MTSFKAVKTLLTRFKSSKKRVSKIYDGHAYTVWNTEFGLEEADCKTVDGSKTYEMTVDAVDGHASAGKQQRTSAMTPRSTRTRPRAGSC